MLLHLLGVSVLQEMSQTLLDHLGARSVDNPALFQDRTHVDLVLRTAAEAAHGVLECLIAPEGDQRIPLSWLRRDWPTWTARDTTNSTPVFGP